MPALDAILIPGGGLRKDGSLPPWVVRRCDRALERHQGGFIITLSAGTPHKAPPLDERGFAIFESVAAARYLVSRGLLPERILVEASSWDTIGNAYFSRVIHAGPRRLRSLLVISSEFHIARTEAVFRWIYSLDGGGYSLRFEATPNDGLDAAAVSARMEKERAALAALDPVRERCRTLAEAHAWIFSQHAAYAVTAGTPPELSANLLETY